MALAAQGSVGASSMPLVGLTLQRIFTRNSFTTNIQTNVIAHVDTMIEVLRGHAKSGKEVDLAALFFLFTLDRFAPSSWSLAHAEQLRRHGLWLRAGLDAVGHTRPLRDGVRLCSAAQCVRACGDLG